jgi:hypothetical protein
MKLIGKEYPGHGYSETKPGELYYNSALTDAEATGPVAEVTIHPHGPQIPVVYIRAPVKLGRTVYPRATPYVYTLRTKSKNIKIIKQEVCVVLDLLCAAGVEVSAEIEWGNKV